MRIEVIVPRGKMFNLDIFKSLTKTGSRYVADQAKREFESSVATWDHKPDFDITYEGDAFQVGTDDDIYALVNNGADPHVILPRRRSRLVFQPEYRSKSVPGSLVSRSGGKSGEPIRARGVNHPGIDARRFDVSVAEKTGGLFVSKMIDAVVTANR